MDCLNTLLNVTFFFSFFSFLPRCKTPKASTSNSVLRQHRVIIVLSLIHSPLISLPTAHRTQTDHLKNDIEPLVKS